MLASTYAVVIGEGHHNDHGIDKNPFRLQSRPVAAYHGDLMWNWFELGVLVALNALIDTVIVLVLQKRSFDGQLKKIWNMKVELEDMNGEVIKVPLTRIIKDKDGNQVETTEMVIAPLWLTIMHGAGQMAAEHVKMAVLSAKGKVARQLNTAALMGDADMNPATIAAIELLPRKYQGIALMLSKYLGKGGTTEGGAVQSSKRGESGFKPGI